MKKTFICVLSAIFSANCFSATTVEKENTYCFAVKQKKDVYVCKTWAEWDATSREDKDQVVNLRSAATPSVEKTQLSSNNQVRKLSSAEARSLLENGDNTWMVQIALAANEANADSIVSKLKAKGYPTKKAMTSKGIRVMVGPNNYQAANELKTKIQNDNSLNAQSAWLFNSTLSQ